MYAISQMGGYDAHDVCRFLGIVCSTNKNGDDGARRGRGGEHGVVHMLPIGCVDGADEAGQALRLLGERGTLGFPEAPSDVL